MVRKYREFPILGGRLLKGTLTELQYKVGVVSNPWREAIEAMMNFLTPATRKVSNPWREAIEVIKASLA